MHRQAHLRHILFDKGAGLARGLDGHIAAIIALQHAGVLLSAVQGPVEAHIHLRAQELLEKADSYAFGPERIHFIGTLQTNKVRQIIGKVCCIQSVNSLHLAREIQKRAQTAGIVLDVLVEVNIGGEESKTGADYSQVMKLMEDLSGFSALRVKGLMCIPPFGKNSLETERFFDQMYKIFVDIKAQTIDNICMETLSMGMTGDYQLAVRHGANLVRVGTGIFGKRN